MIKAILLVFEPALHWEKIAQSKKGFCSVLFLYLLPTLLLSVAGELAGIFKLGKIEELHHIVNLSPKAILTYGAVQFGSSLIVVFMSAIIIKSLAETFNSRHSFTQCFILVSYALGPLLLLRIADGVPGVNPWVTFGIGIALALHTLYQGVPRVLDPDPPHTFGLYMCSWLLLAIICALARLLTLIVLVGRTNIATTF